MLDVVNGQWEGGGDAPRPDVLLRLTEFVIVNKLAESRENIVGVAVAQSLKNQLRREMEERMKVRRGFKTRDQWTVEGFPVYFVKALPCDFGIIY